RGGTTGGTTRAGGGPDTGRGGTPEARAREGLAGGRARTAGPASEPRRAPPAGEERAEPYRGSIEPRVDEEARYQELVAKYKEQCDAERQEVLKAGGLKIVGTERHESRRIDNQLRGRAGRQGDPGTSRFYLSLQDDLLRIFG